MKHTRLSRSFVLPSLAAICSVAFLYNLGHRHSTDPISMAGPAETRLAELFPNDAPYVASLEQPARPPITIVAGSEELERADSGAQK